MSHIQLFSHQYPPSPSSPFPTQFVEVLLEIALPGAGPCAGLVEFHEVCMAPLPKLISIPVDGIPSLQHVVPTTWLAVICGFARDVLNPLWVMEGDTEHSCSL